MAENVFSNPLDNTYLSITTTLTHNDASTNETHTRIYEYFPTTIQLDEMSIPLTNMDNSDSTIDPTTKLHVDAANSNANGNIYKTEGNTSATKALDIGFGYPLLRINDHYYTNTDISYFELETTGFIPTIIVKLECSYNDILKVNSIKDGDKCSVFINPGHGTIKSYRGDFLITKVKVSNMDQFKIDSKIYIRFVGELFIPTLYDATQTFAFSGSSRDALIDAAQKLGLGFFFSDPENTTDTLMWYSMSDGELKTMGLSSTSPAIEYIKNTAKHAYKNFPSFYDCWIDPRYAISFINIALMLGGSGLDENIDLALYNSTMAMGRGTDAENRESTDEEKAQNPRPLVKLLTNIGEDEASLTSFLVTSYAEHNDGSITNKYGLKNSNYYSIKNTGIQQVEDNAIEMNLSIPVNSDKLKHGFYVMAGPGLNLTYTEGQNGSFTDLHKSVQGGKIAESQSDGDAKDILESGNNMLASGNTNKFYETAEGHNELCNVWLKKKTISVTLNGCNMQLMKGEKIPMLLKDNFNPATTYMQAKNSDQLTYQKILVSGTGWFIIKDIKWIFDVNKPQKGTLWRTELTLTRREWPIPGYSKNGLLTELIEEMEELLANIIIENDINSGTTRDAEYDLNGEITLTQQTDEQTNTSGEMTTNGVNSYLVNIYNEIKLAVSAGGDKIVLVSARRWPVDDNNNVVATPTVQDGNLWKYKNAKGDIVWYSSKTSPHNTGDAIDIINGENTSFEKVLEYIVADDKILYDMITNGVYLGLEVSSDGGDGIKHYHIGKIDKSNSDTSKVLAAWWNLVASKKKSITYNGHTVNVAQYLAYTNK